jgi:hypothetical protein
MQYRQGGLDELAVDEIKAQEDARVVATLEGLAGARERAAALLAKRQELDATEATYLKLAAEYGGNRRGRRRARAEVDRAARKKKRGAAG